MRLDGGYLAVECAGDVDVVIDLPGWAIEQPHLPYSPRLKPFALTQVRKGEPVAGIGIDRLQRGGPGSEVIGVTTAEPLPIPFRAPRHYPLGADPPDLPDEFLMQLTANAAQPFLGNAQEQHMNYPQGLGGTPLLGPADIGDFLPRDSGVEPARLTIGQHAVWDV